MPGLDGTGKLFAEFVKRASPAVCAVGRIVLGAALREIDGPHLLLQTRAAECAEAVLDFLRPSGHPAKNDGTV
jgi:hypothetical protein